MSWLGVGLKMCEFRFRVQEYSEFTQMRQNFYGISPKFRQNRNSKIAAHS